MSVGPEVPFTLQVPDTAIELLHKKLELTRFPDELEDAGWDYGVPLAHVKQLVERWKNGFDWRKFEAEINKLPQFMRDIPVEGFGTLNIHYLHQKSARANAIPLLFVHGWPGHFLEVRKILPQLIADVPDQPSFHVVALSLPGFGFSEAAKKRGFASDQYAEVSHKLMISLGYSEYVVQGGDFGHFVANALARNYGKTHVKGVLSNNTDVPPPSLSSEPWLYLINLLIPYTAKERKGLAESQAFLSQGTGYSHLHATVPQTVGYSLADSPVGLLAWIYEKLVVWTDAYPWEDDEVLEWVSIYWFSRAGPTASIRIYHELSDRFTRRTNTNLKRIPVPLGFSVFPKELMRLPRRWRGTLGSIVFESEHERGGHFASHEQPDELVKDIRAMFGKGGPAFGVVTGHSGYA